ncbi:hypothetical protein [Streptomyces sp. NPDC007883]|uniref:hypothetical protein n=1 Tax=Streptomyces sp. NPDC007883 TaxID=3155116 RepID=UPI00340F8B75
MRLAGAHTAVRRIWTVELRPGADGPSLVCVHCTARAPALQASSARSAVLAHLACHARTDALPGHLRTCQCQAQRCRWHPRHRGCAGPVLLALTSDRGGRAWRLADTCAACAAATSNTAVVPDTLPGPHRPHTTAHTPASTSPSPFHDHLRVREMLTYLATALPQFTSPAARLLALQCALRADSRGRVRLPAGLLRGMRLHGRRELWEELAHAGWLELPDPTPAHLTVRLLDPAVLEQAPDRSARHRAAHWAMHSMPLALPAAAPSALHLTALVLAAHACAQARHSADLEVLARLCGHSRQQTEELLDRLVAARTLTAWHHHRETGEAVWHLPRPQPTATPRAQARPRPGRPR